MAVVARVVAVADVEVQHPPRVGSQLVVAGIERIAQRKLSAGIALRRNDNLLTLHQHAVGRQQFHVEYAAHVGRPQIVGTHDVGLIPQGVAHKVAHVIGVDIYFLLHLGDR